MSVTFTEREAIKKMLDYIETERERLSNQSLNLLDRLRELDEIEAPIPDRKPDLKALAEILSPVPVIDEIPDVTPIELYEDTKEFANVPIPEWFPQEEEKEIIPKTEIEALKDIDQKNKPVRTSSQRDVKMIAQYIKAILKSSEVPMKTAELIKQLKEAGIDVSSPYVLLAQASQYEPRIQKAGFGYYQYKW